MKQEKQQKQVQPKKIEESLSYSVEVRDKEGRVLHRISAPSRSYVEQWNQLINLQATQVAKTIKDIGGIDRTPDADDETLGAYGGITMDDIGIVVGKGTTAVAIDDYALESQCVEGVGVDQFNYQLQIWTEPSVAGSTCSFTARRSFINNSGATISGIKEIGCYVRCHNAATYHMLGFRDVLPSAVYVPHGGSITVTYTIAATV